MALIPKIPAQLENIVHRAGNLARKANPLEYISLGWSRLSPRQKGVVEIAMGIGLLAYSGYAFVELKAFTDGLEGYIAGFGSLALSGQSVISVIDGYSLVSKGKSWVKGETKWH